jgi:hypothetical protein
MRESISNIDSTASKGMMAVGAPVILTKPAPAAELIAQIDATLSSSNLNQSTLHELPDRTQ